jgi:hypothetical protein
MYSALWRGLPGPTWARVLTLVLATTLVVLVLFEWVFPWVSEMLPYQEQTVGE